MLKPGDRLPPIRKLSEILGINSITAVKAYDLLEQRSLVTKKRGSGVYIQRGEENAPIPDSDELYLDREIELMRQGSVELSASVINFATATPSSDLFPAASFKRALNAVLDRDGGRAFEYDEANGYTPLREQVADLLARRYSIGTSPDRLQAISGAQQGIDIAAKALLSPGDEVIVEEPTYTGALAVFKSRGARITGIPMTSSGMNISRLKKALSSRKVRLIYLMPDFQNPTTVSYTPEKRQALLELARSFQCYIIEDDYLSDMHFAPRSLPKPLKSYDTPVDERVIYIKSFSKLLMPGLRIGFLTAPKPIARSILQAKHLTDIASSGLIQRAFDLYLRSGEWETHLEQIRSLFQYRHRLLLRSVGNHFGSRAIEHPPAGGFNLWLRLPGHAGGTELYRRALAKSVAVTPGILFSTNGMQYDEYIRLSIAAVAEEHIDPGIALLAEAVRELGRAGNPGTTLSPMM